MILAAKAKLCVGSEMQISLECPSICFQAISMSITLESTVDKEREKLLEVLLYCSTAVQEINQNTPLKSP